MPAAPDDATPRRLTDEQVERYLRGYRDTEKVSREKLHEFLSSELGWDVITEFERGYRDTGEMPREKKLHEYLNSELTWEIITAYERNHGELVDTSNRLRALKQEGRDQVAAIKSNMLGTTLQVEFVYGLVGEFIVKFSQIEFWLRVAFGIETKPKLPQDVADAILAKLDFQSLVAVTSTMYQQQYVGAPELWNRVRRIFSDCLALNDERNHIAHGSWIVSDSKMVVRHLSRQKMQWQEHFPSPEELKVQIVKLDALDAELQKLLSGDYDPPCESGSEPCT